MIANYIHQEIMHKEVVQALRCSEISAGCTIEDAYS